MACGEGRHNPGKGYLNDLDKLNAAQAAGWRVFQLGTRQVTIERLQTIIDRYQGDGNRTPCTWATTGN